MDNKTDEKSSYSLKASVISGKLELQLTYERSKYKYVGLYDAELLRTCGFPVNMCTDLHNVSKFLMSAKVGVDGIQFVVKTGETRQIASISVIHEVGACRILDIKLELEQKTRDKFDILEEQIEYLNSENQRLNLQLKNQTAALKSTNDKLDQIMSKFTNDLENVTQELTKQVALNVEQIKTEHEHAMPKGSIHMWSGSIDDIPKGWQLCDGSDGGPNLGDKFIVGASGSLGTRQTGGSKFHDHVSATYNSVNHLPPYCALCFIVKVI